MELCALYSMSPDLSFFQVLLVYVIKLKVSSTAQWQMYLLSFVQKTATLFEFYLPSKLCHNSNIQYLNKIENVTDNLLLGLLLLLGNNIHLCLISTLISSAECIVHEQSPGNHRDQDLIMGKHNSSFWDCLKDCHAKDKPEMLRAVPEGRAKI